VIVGTASIGRAGPQIDQIFVRRPSTRQARWNAPPTAHCRVSGPVPTHPVWTIQKASTADEMLFSQAESFDI